MSDDAPVSDPSAMVCLACGMCCDGTLFGNVELDDDEADHAASIGLDVHEVPGKGMKARQPCPAHSGAGCTVYNDRPSTCCTFRCPTLIAMERGEISASDALRRVEDTLASRDVVLRATGAATPFRAREVLDRMVADGEADPALMLEMFALERQLDLHFREEKDQRTMTKT